jgi:hypothetical protein
LIAGWGKATEGKMSWTVRESDADFATVVEIEEQTDRAAAIIAGSYLEDFLAAAIRSKFTQDEKVLNQFFNGMGPLATFSAKIDMAYLLHLVDEDNRKRLHQIRRIRNEFAHDLSPLKFETLRIADMCRAIYGSDENLNSAIAAAQEKGLGPHGEADGNPRNTYLAAIRILTFYLDLATPLTARSEPSAPQSRLLPDQE